MARSDRSSVVLVALALALAACGTDRADADADGDAGTADGGARDVQEVHDGVNLDTLDPADTTDTTDADGDDGLPMVVTLTVTLDGAPAAGVRVTQNGTTHEALTDVDGRAVIAADPHVDGEIGFTASHPDARQRGATVLGGRRALTIELVRFARDDNPDYVFQDPGEPERRDTSAQCAHCHASIASDWFASPHRSSAANATVQDLYRDVVLPTLNACATPDCADATRFGACADCHAPGIDGAVLGGRDLRDATGRAHDYGVHCDVCHRVAHVDLAAPAGVAGRLGLVRPSERSTSVALGTWQPLTFGPSHDVPNPRMGLVQRDHFHEATLCAGCHELAQEVLVPGAAIDRARWPDGRLPVHTTYSELRQGPLGADTADRDDPDGAGDTIGVACQSCHMPPAPAVGNGADLAAAPSQRGGVATGWLRPPGTTRRHTWYGPRQRDSRLLELAAALTIDVAHDGDVPVARVTVTNVGPGHALPTGEPLRHLVVVVDATCDGAALPAIGGDVVPDYGGAHAVATSAEAGPDWRRWPGARAGEVVHVVRRGTAFYDYVGYGPFGDGTFAPDAKGLPRDELAGSATIISVAGDVVTFDRPLPAGDVAYRVAAPAPIVDGAPARALAGAAGFAFARVLVGADGARMVPHHAAVDVASDNRLLPQASWTSEHRFGACAPAATRVHATLVHRAFPVALAAERGWDLVDSVMAEATSAQAPPLVTAPPAPMSGATVEVHLRAARTRLVQGGVEVDAIAYDGQVPGPTIRAKVGDRLVVTLDNALEVPTTIHWHGLRVPWAMDGATWKQAPVAPGASATYDFVLSQAGTFWYHPHFDAEHQVDLGLFGALVVEDPSDPRADDDRVFVFDTWAESDGVARADDGHAAPDDDDDDHDVPAAPAADAPDAAGDAHAHGHGVDDRTRRWLVDGALDPHITIAAGTRVRARFVNASNSGYLALGAPGMRVIGGDQGLLAAPRDLAAGERLELAPGDRAEVEWRVGPGGFVVDTLPMTLHGGAIGEPPVRLMTISGDGDAPAPEPIVWPFSGAAPTPDSGRSDVVWTLHGSAHADTWRINGAAFPDGAPADLALGQDAVIEVRNLGATRHPFHIHGHTFEVLNTNGVRPAHATIEDTIDLPLYTTVRLRLVADNPGEWMAHCHILPHAHGMMTLLRVGVP